MADGRQTTMDPLTVAFIFVLAPLISILLIAAAIIIGIRRKRRFGGTRRARRVGDEYGDTNTSGSSSWLDD